MRVRVVVIALLVLFATGQTAAAENKAALVIGNGAYRSITPLANPANDAADMAQVLAATGHAVTLVTDGDLATMNDGLRRFLRSADRADSVVIFYAGHGLQVKGRNYLIPVDADIQDELDLDSRALSLDKVIELVDGAAVKVKIIILDSCRDNPLARSLTRSAGGRGLARIELDPAQARGTLIAFSTAPGAVAQDGTGRNSPFTAALLRHAATPGLDIRQMFGQVRADVDEATQGAQTPWVNESIIGFFSLGGGGSPKPAAPREQPAPVALPADPETQSPVADAVLPSFSCEADLNAVERRICANPDLAALDQLLASAYAKAIGGLSTDQRKPISTMQRAWVKARNACRDDECIESAYRQRVEELVSMEQAGSSGPGFDCSASLSAVEATICDDPDLSALDRRLGDYYFGLARRLTGATRERLVADQRRFIAARDDCGPDPACIRSQYRGRIAVLIGGY